MDKYLYLQFCFGCNDSLLSKRNVDVVKQDMKFWYDWMETSNIINVRNYK